MRTNVLLHLQLILIWCWCCLTHSAVQRGARGNLIAFNTIGHDVSLGLDFEMPFVRVPIGRHLDKTGQPRAMITINTGAIVTSTLLAGGSLLVGYLLKSLGIQGTGKHPVHDVNASTPHRRNANDVHKSDGQEHYDTDAAAEGDDTRKATRKLGVGGGETITKTLQALKMVYTNATGARVEITLPQLYDQLEQSFAERDVDLQACMWQSVCTMVQQAQAAMHAGRASAVQKILDGVVQIPWLHAALRHTAIGDAIQAAEVVRTEGSQCVQHYVSCNLIAPHEKFVQLLRTHVQFT